jgi:hypothetical protein
MIGRADPWVLAANGHAGVENALDILSGIGSALLALGRSSVTKLSHGDLLIPNGFTRWVAATEPVAAALPPRARASALRAEAGARRFVRVRVTDHAGGRGDAGERQQRGAPARGST